MSLINEIDAAFMLISTIFVMLQTPAIGIAQARLVLYAHFYQS